jgi:hypothetical protein
MADCDPWQSDTLEMEALEKDEEPITAEGLTICAEADFCERQLTTKELGEMVELRLMAKASQEKFRVLKPWGDSARYDSGLDNGKRIWRVQVRSAATLTRDDFYWFKTQTNDRGGVRPYKRSDIDFFVAYVMPFDAWYVIPVRVIQKVKGIGLAPHRQSNAKYEKYREAWYLMK